MTLFLKKIASFALILTLSMSFQSFDCDDEDFVDECAMQIAGYKFLKANKITISGAKKSSAVVEVKQVFSKGNTYVLTACSGSKKNLKVTLYDRSGKKRLISNYSKSKKKFYPKVTYKCTATGVYYLKYEFEDETAYGCGLGIIGFKNG